MTKTVLFTDHNLNVHEVECLPYPEPRKCIDEDCEFSWTWNTAELDDLPRWKIDEIICRYDKDYGYYSSWEDTNKVGY